jgi:hypothetical protein
VQLRDHLVDIHAGWNRQYDPASSLVGMVRHTPSEIKGSNEDRMLADLLASDDEE